MGLLIRVHSRKGLPFFAVEIFRFLLLAHSCIKIMYQRQPLLCFSFGKSMLVFYLLPIFFYMAMSWYSGVYDNNKHLSKEDGRILHTKGPWKFTTFCRISFLFLSMFPAYDIYHGCRPCAFNGIMIPFFMFT